MHHHVIPFSDGDKARPRSPFSQSEHLHPVSVCLQPGAQRPLRRTIQHWSEQPDAALLTVSTLQIGHRHHS